MASFFPTKPLGCFGDGGAICFPDDQLAKAMREIRTHGQERRYYHTRIGVGGRMDTLQCAVILAKLDIFDWEIAERIRIGRTYRDMVAEIPGIQAPAVRNDRTCVWAQFTVKTDKRDTVVAALKDAGVPTAIHYPIPVHKQPAYQSLCRVVGGLETSERLGQQVLSLPMHPYLEAETMNTIVDTLAKAARSS